MGKRKIGNLWEVIDLKQKETFLCIDLKSFYASVECVERGLDPFTTNLVVADPDRSVSTICLAITPAMKKLGIRNRCRIHEIPDHIEYIVAKPRMQLYMEYSARIYGIYLKKISMFTVWMSALWMSQDTFPCITLQRKKWHKN